MIALLDRCYTFLFDGMVLLAGNPLACAAVAFLREMTLWIALVLILRLVAEVLYVAWLRRTSPLVDDSRQTNAFERCRQQTHPRARVELREARAGMAPAFTTGILRPVVYLAPGLASALDGDELEAVFRHELAHVERRDNLILRIGRTMAAVTVLLLIEAFALAGVMGTGLMHFGFWNAVALLLMGIATVAFLQRSLGTRFRTHIELCCDARAVTLGADPLALASAILATSRLNRAGGRFDFAAQMLSPCARMIDRRVRHLVEARGRDVSALTLDRSLRFAFIILLAATAIYMHDFHLRTESENTRPAATAQR